MVSDAIQEFMSKATNNALVTTEGLVEKLLAEAEYVGEGASHSARIAALKTLTDYTGGFDNNKQKVESKVQTVDDSDLTW
jgi:phage terminase small subunit